MGQNVTYLICNYNNVQWIHEAITSAKNQTVKCRICVVDDGSTDASIDVIMDSLWGGKIVSKIEENGYIKHTDGNHLLICLPENHGPSYARNVGIQNTIKNTDVYAILDADDTNYPNKVQRCLEELEDERISVVYADYDILNVDTGITRREFKQRYSREGLMKECIVHSGSLIRAKYLDAVRELSGWYDIDLRCAEDYDLWLRLAEISLISHVPESLSMVRVHDNNSTNSVKQEVWQKCWKRVSEKLHARNNKKK